MPCPCPTNTLRLFIRIVAQVELPTSATRSSRPRWQKAAIRNFSSIRQHRAASESLSKSYIPFETPLQDIPKPQYGSQEWAQGVVEGTIALRNEKIESTLHAEAGEGQAEVTTTASDGEVSSRVQSRKLRKERRREKFGQTQDTVEEAEGESTPVQPPVTFKKSFHGGHQGRHPAVDVKPIIRVIGEKQKVYDTGFKIHYSAPMAPGSARPPKPYSKPAAKPSVSVQEKKPKDYDEWEPPKREPWQIDKDALKAKFPDGWKPMRRLSPDALAGIRALHAQDPAQYTTAVLADSFQVSPEAMRRILKSKWSPKPEEESDRLRRWENRGKSVYSRYVELGTLTKPPKKWRDMGIGKGKPEWLLKKEQWNRERAKRAKMPRMPLPALIASGRARDEKYGFGRERRIRREKEPLPALVTTRRADSGQLKFGQRGGESLEDRIL